MRPAETASYITLKINLQRGPRWAIIIGETCTAAIKELERYPAIRGGIGFVEIQSRRRWGVKP